MDLAGRIDIVRKLAALGLGPSSNLLVMMRETGISAENADLFVRNAFEGKEVGKSGTDDGHG